MVKLVAFLLLSVSAAFAEWEDVDPAQMELTTTARSDFWRTIPDVVKREDRNGNLFLIRWRAEPGFRYRLIKFNEDFEQSGVVEVPPSFTVPVYAVAAHTGARYYILQRAVE